MDQFLVDYVKSGKAWLLIGSGPSTQRGYPSWRALAEVAVATAVPEARGAPTDAITQAMISRDYPAVFEEAKVILGGPRLLQALRGHLRPSSMGSNAIYKLLARWPIPVYLTTNYDDEIQVALAELSEAYITYSNAPDHLAHLVPELSGAIVKLHGDLTTENGLILTSSSYRAIENDRAWLPWRTKLTSVFQMNRVVVVGHSLTDSNVKQVLEAAKQGAGVILPVCWIAPNVSTAEAKRYLEQFRIRVVSYDNRDGTHSGLLRLLENVNEFIPPRVSIGLTASIGRVARPSGSESAAASSFFVFNKLASDSAYDSKRILVVLAAIEAELSQLQKREPFTIADALSACGWPADIQIAPDFERQLADQAIARQILERAGDKFTVARAGLVSAAASRQAFDHMRNRFLASLVLRIRRQYPLINEHDARQLAHDIDSALVGYFAVGGLSLVSTLFTERTRDQAIPASILAFISEASAQYGDFLKRQAFVDASVGCFARPESADKDYLGRISQGFVGFHMLGTFGAAAGARLGHAKESIWLMDSSPQIFALALASPMNAVFSGALKGLRQLGIRLFTTESLFDETREHFWFAKNLVRQHGAASPELMASAQGTPPYRKSNSFLEGFIAWRGAGNPADWGTYVSAIFGTADPSRDEQRATLARLGIETVPFPDWPGFQQLHFAEREQYAADICGKIDPEVRAGRVAPPNSTSYEKAIPEGEALVVVVHERNGTYNIARTPPGPKDSWFISATSGLNLLDGLHSRVTWQPDSFVQFASTLAPVADAGATERAFEILLLNVARSGLKLLDDRVVEQVFGGIIEQAGLSMAEQTTSYRDMVAAKYGEAPESVLARVSPVARPLAALQLANEVSARSEKALRVAEVRLGDEQRKLKDAGKKLEALEKVRSKIDKKAAQSRARAKKQKNKAKTGQKGKRK